MAKAKDINDFAKEFAEALRKHPAVHSVRLGRKWDHHTQPHTPRRDFVIGVDPYDAYGSLDTSGVRSDTRAQKALVDIGKKFGFRPGKEYGHFSSWGSIYKTEDYDPNLDYGEGRFTLYHDDYWDNTKSMMGMRTNPKRTVGRKLMKRRRMGITSPNEWPNPKRRRNSSSLKTQIDQLSRYAMDLQWALELELIPKHDEYYFKRELKSALERLEVLSKRAAYWKRQKNPRKNPAGWATSSTSFNDAMRLGLFRSGVAIAHDWPKTKMFNGKRYRLMGTFLSLSNSRNKKDAERLVKEFHKSGKTARMASKTRGDTIFRAVYVGPKRRR